MKGGIYANKGPGAPWRVKYGKTYKRFWSKKDAEIFWAGLILKDSEGNYSERDYRRDNPMGLANQAAQWLNYRKKEVKCFRNLTNHMGRACGYFQNRNIKDVSYAELEDFLQSLPEMLSGKTKANIFATLHAFFVWLKRRGEIKEVPEFPKVKYELGWRKTVDKATQAAIGDEIYRLSYNDNPKIWIGFKWLCTYIAIRPIELIHIQERDFRHELGGVDVWYSKTGDPKFVPFLPDDLELAQQYGPAFPSLYFFRHTKGNGHARPGSRFGKDLLWKRCRDALRSLAIDEEGLSLYGITRHSSVRALRETHTPEEIRRASMHKTNAAFDRYYQIEMGDVRQVYADTRPALKDNVVDLKKRKIDRSP